MRFESLLDKECHLECSLYQKNRETIFDILNYDEGFKTTRQTKGVTLAFLTKGKIKYSYGDREAQIVKRGSLFVMPNQTEFTLNFIKSGCLLCYYIQPEVEFCHRVKNTALRNKHHNANTKSINIAMNKFIRETLKRFTSAVDEGLLCKRFLLSIMEEIVIYICTFYPLNMLEKFFSPIFYGESSHQIFNENTFKKTVVNYRNSVFCVAEMANLTNLSVRSFRFRFREVFDMSPKEWMNEERKKYIYNELTKGSKSVKELSIKTGFQYESDFYRYCRKMFGDTPQNIRKGGEI
ncbi:MAG: helix-turn-helix domain-containing protein [Dysgonamonadaceae bacterium]|jgi:AraC-like DNA-binding protein|nr:helix-turn-helix domain-containing protein [Dysgonamonadaceae bacterium]